VESGDGKGRKGERRIELNVVGEQNDSKTRSERQRHVGRVSSSFRNIEWKEVGKEGGPRALIKGGGAR